MNKELDTILLGNRLRERRKKARFTVLQAAEKIGKSDKLIEKWEHGDRVPKTEDLVTLCNLYGGAADYYLGREDFPEFTPGADATAKYLGITVYEAERLQKAISPGPHKSVFSEMIRSTVFSNLLSTIIGAQIQIEKLEKQWDEGADIGHISYEFRHVSRDIKEDIANWLWPITQAAILEHNINKAEDEAKKVAKEEAHDGEHQEV